MDLTSMKEAVLTIALIALIGAAALIGLADYKTELTTLPKTTTNESVTASSAAYTSVSNCGQVRTTVKDISSYHINASYLTALTLKTHYNVSGCAIIYSATYNGNKTQVNYTSEYGSYSYNITMAGEESIDKAGSFFDTIGTIIGVAALIGLVILAFSFGRR